VSTEASVKEVSMAGIIVFETLYQALREGYSVYDKTAEGFLMRIQTKNGWGMALVKENRKE
jgi:hypothetical protein